MAQAGFIRRVALVLEALLGGFYVSVTRGLFVPMLTYSGYPTGLISQVLLPTSIGGILISLLLYERPGMLTNSFRYSLLLLHISEKIAWLFLPFLLQDPRLVSAAYLMANIISAIVSIAMGALIFSIFGAEEVIEISIHRSAASSAASILGSLFMTYVSAALEPPSSYQLCYITAALIGLSSSLSLLLVPGIPGRIFEEAREEEEAKVRSSAALLVLSLMLAGGNMVGISWSPLLREMGAPMYLAVALSVTANLGGALGSYLWRSYRAYALAILMNTVITLTIPFIRVPVYHVGLSLLTSLTFIGANLLGTQIFSDVSRRLGRVRASAYLTSSNYTGLLLAVMISMARPFSSSQLLLLAGLIKLSGLALTLLAIPETAVIPARRAYEVSRMIYSTSLLGYSFTSQASREFLRTMIATIFLTILVTVLYVIYRVVTLILGI
ncbi:MAG: hypothetical protein BA066_04245 [Candidatus Korarchaeota archaeon NZ13-K]|nr:MAG: hypothetical protein BA066_04245 [Candidatus Korarchaeota archaeon NZ13-K]